jgi:hypothetical protein
MNHRRTENRVASLRLCIEKEPLESIAEASFDDFGKISEYRRRLAAADEDDLDSLAASFHHQLEITQGAAMGSIGVGRNARFANRLANFAGCLIDQRMMDGAVRHVHDAMAVALKQADLGVSGLPADRQTGAVTVAMTGERVDPRFRQFGRLR